MKPDRVRPKWTHDEVLTFPGSVAGHWSRYVENPNSRGIGTVRYPRPAANDDECAKQLLTKRTLTNLDREPASRLDVLG